ncbi:tRNA-dihydrouridine synthase [Campylobacter gastrosuis]|uniref:tRNA-dihydrouridine synthase n=1 Tax=Campylobacter gastrosuis TaxID=2974576 RepID=A0ABT7HQK4_9BACT|nr:tRNA-dihydrouridine synthase [Campylobacter gastrosuis]MDL0088997.1 tRNA-dihydrouridine synthase [Campylobacter gastrosuis]
MAKLFSPLQIGKISVKNRIVMPPMCLYKVSLDDGKPTKFHTDHYTARALGGVGLIIVEATAVLPEGRITNADLGLWSDEQVLAHKNLVDSLKFYDLKVGIQLAHAGRKSMCVDSTPLSSCEIKFDENYKTPKNMSLDEIDNFKQSFVSSAIKAQKAGYDLIEIHAAHGYLLNQFLSKKLNQRDDKYKDGSLLLKEILTQVKANVSCAVGVRLSATTYQSDDYGLDECVKLCVELEKTGADFLHISSGGVYANPDISLKIAPLYQAEFAKAVKKAVKIPVIAVGLIKTGSEGEALLLGDVCDLVAYGRELLKEPNLAYKMASELNEKSLIENSYQRAF